MDSVQRHSVDLDNSHVEEPFIPDAVASGEY